MTPRARPTTFTTAKHHLYKATQRRTAPYPWHAAALTYMLTSNEPLRLSHPRGCAGSEGPPWIRGGRRGARGLRLTSRFQAVGDHTARNATLYLRRIEERAATPRGAHAQRAQPRAPCAIHSTRAEPHAEQVAAVGGLWSVHEPQLHGLAPPAGRAVPHMVQVAPELTNVHAEHAHAADFAGVRTWWANPGRAPRPCASCRASAPSSARPSSPRTLR